MKSTTSYIPPTERWKLLAACRDETINTFFPISTEGKRVVTKAHFICRTCPVKLACLNYALANNMAGYWGDTSERERRRIKQKNRKSSPRLDKLTLEPVSVAQ